MAQATQSRVEPARRALALLWGLGGLGVIVASVDVGLYLLHMSSEPIPRTALQPGKLTILCILFAILALSLWGIAWRTLRSSNSATNWSSGPEPFLAILATYLLAVYYPTPPHLHHTDKLLFLVGGLSAWITWLLWFPTSARESPNSRINRWVKVGLINLIVFVVVGEVILRVTDPLLARHGLFAREVTPANLKPFHPVQGSIGHTNSHGFKDRERSFVRHCCAPRIVALGDSFLWGLGVTYDESAMTLLEQSLQRVSPGAEVINLGRPGFELEHYFHLLRTYAINFDPDLVLVNVYVGNDLMRKRGADIEEAVIVAGQTYYVHKNGNWVHDHIGPDRWHLYHNVRYLLTMGRIQVPQWLGIDSWDFGGVAGVSSPAASVRHDQANPGRDRVRWHPDYITSIDARGEIYVKQDTPMFEFHWENASNTLEAMRRFLRDRGIPFFLLLAPDPVQVIPEVQKLYLSSIGASDEEYDFDKPQRLLRNWATAHGVESLDLLPHFRAYRNPAHIYISNDQHWNAQGHSLVAHILSPIFRAKVAAIAMTRQD